MTKQQKPRLGRGLASLIGTPVEVAPTATAQKIIDSDDTSSVSPEQVVSPGVRSIPLADIVPSQFQPRETFAPASLAALAASIRASGVMQPILVRACPPGRGAAWELIAGERRWRAAAIAQLEAIPAIVVDIDDQQAAEWALVENVQREDLNAMERARALRALVDRFGLSHATLGERVGLERSSVANLIRLTELEPEVQALLALGVGENGGGSGGSVSAGLSMGHGKALLGARPGSARVELAKRAAKEAWSVRRLETAVRDMNEGKPSPPKPGTAPGSDADVNLRALERQLSERMGTKVRLVTNRDRSRGRIIIEYYGIDHFDGVMRSLGGWVQP